jgi:predicted transposase YdaD
VFRDVFAAVLRRLEALSESERMRWHDLLWFVLSWALRRRPGEEREGLLETARSSQMELKHREEVAQLSETVVETWEQELLARGEARGRAEGEARGRAEGEAQGLRESVQLLLEEKFGPLPEALVAEIGAMEDTERLRRVVRQVVHLNSLDELAL